jgi:thymidylate synthase ThyX
MSNERQVYLLDPGQLPPETIAVTFAKTSRSPQSFKEIAAELTEEKSSQFHEKWVVNYGHSSVAEHAVLHIAVENISRLAVEALESNRLASYTEKSSRYQTWGPSDFHIPQELRDHPLKEIYTQTCQKLFETYHLALDVLPPAAKSMFPQQPEETRAAWDRRLRTNMVDVARYLLPAASLANVGVTINARALEHALRKMMSSPLQEVRQIAEEMKDAALKEVPTLVKYIESLPHLQKAYQMLPAFCPPQSTDNGQEQDWLRLVDWDPSAEERILAAALYRFSGVSYTQAQDTIIKLSPAQKREMADLLLGNLRRHDIPLRELEFTNFTFDLVLDQGAYFELKRHRMMSQTPQSLTTHLGYAVPRMVTLAGFEQPFCEAMHTAQQAYERLVDVSPCVAAYVVPNAFNRRVLIHTNLRSAYHLINLRTAENAHFAIRRAAQRIAEELRSHLPLFAQSLSPNPAESWQSLQEQFFTRVR